MNITRRQLMQTMAMAMLTGSSRVFAGTAQTTTGLQSNFHYIYDNPRYKAEFLPFLENVFHLFPADQLHEAIAAAVAHHKTDAEIYTMLQPQLDMIKPFLGDLTHSLPALGKQKKVLAAQTMQLLGTDQRVDGYLEFGTTGRYADPLEEVINIEGERYFIADKESSYSPVDMVDRGQIAKAGTYIDFAHYRPDIAAHIPAQSLELVTVFIGFHHCPIPLRDEFLQSIRTAMKPGARMVVRDHDVTNEKMWEMVALAHDVFNMGTMETWNTNSHELRNFYSLQTLDEMLTRNGFVGDGRRLRQDGDPTLNSLMLYTKA